MRVETITCKAPTMEYRFDSNGKLFETISLEQADDIIIYILYADDGKLLRNIETLEIVGEQIKISSPEEANVYDEIPVEDITTETEG